MPETHVRAVNRRLTKRHERERTKATFRRRRFTYRPNNAAQGKQLRLMPPLVYIDQVRKPKIGGI